MERQLKERLVGAAVLMAMAVILIPEMLSGPRRAPAPAAPAGERSEGNLKRYTIELDGAKPPAAVPESSNIEVAPPAAEEVPPEEKPLEASPTADSAAATPMLPEPVAESPPEGSAAAPIETPAPAPVVQTEPAPPALPVQAPPQQAATAAPTPPAAAATGSTRRWAVQLIAYDNRARAQRMAEDLRESNYAAFVMPVQSATGTLYRVRVGPFATRAEADNALRKLKTVTSDPTIVAQP